MVEAPKHTAWREYATEKPASAGVYEWQVPSRACKEMVVRVLAHFRERGAGYRTILSPEFDYWDGARVHVPAGTMWRDAPAGTELKLYRQELVCVEGLEVSPCPFCKRTPCLQGVEGSASGGVVVTSDAHRFNRWWLECCSWARTPRYTDPRELEAARRKLLDRVEAEDRHHV